MKYLQSQNKGTMKVLAFDVMLRGRFVCTMKYRYCPLFPLEIDELKKFIEDKHPSLKGKDYTISLFNKKNTNKLKNNKILEYEFADYKNRMDRTNVEPRNRLH